MHEVLTIQLGQLANFVGTHFWNAQNEYFEYGDQAMEPEFDHDILYRAGVNQRGIETYTPRVMIYDLKGGFGSIKKYNKLFQDDFEEQHDTWGEKVEQYKSPQHPKNRFQQHLDKMDEDVEESTEMEMDLDQSVNVWSDFNSNFFHPNSLHQINGYQMGNSIQPFDTYNSGYAAYDENEKETDSFDEAFRFFAEECDQLQGFQIFASVQDGFGGFTCGLLENVRDEYAKASILTYGISEVQPPSSQRSAKKTNLNITMATAGLSEYSSLYIPIHLPDASDLRRPWTHNLSFKPYLRYQTSAIAAVAIESASITWRLKKHPRLMSELIGAVNWQGNHNIASLGVSFPINVKFGKRNSSAADSFPIENGRFITLKNLTVDDAKKDEEVFGECTVLRGIPDIERRDAYIEDIFNYISGADLPHKLRTTADAGVPLPLSFPKIISPTFEDYTTGNDDPAWAKESVPALSQIRAGSHMYSYFENQRQTLRGLNYRMFCEYEEGGRGKSAEDFEQLKDWLIEQADNFRPSQ